MQRADRVLAAVAATTIVASLARLAATTPPMGPILAAAGLIAVADLLRVRLTGERPSSLAIAPGLGFALLSGDPASVVVAFALGTGTTAALRRIRHAHRAPAGGHLLSVTAGALIYAALAGIDPTLLASADGAARLAPLALLAAVAGLAAVDATIRFVRSTETPSAVIRALLPFQLAAASAAALFALAEPVLGIIAYPLFLAPLLATHHAFTQLTSVRRTFAQMVRALSTVPEIAGYSHPGHAARTAAIARSIGRELRMRDRELGEVEIAARLHDLGRMRAGTPDQVATLPAAELAAGGAQVVRSTGALPRVASIIERSHEPFRGQTTMPLGARVIRVASTFDDLTNTGDGSLSQLEALASMRRGRDERFDPEVLRALEAIVAAG